MILTTQNLLHYLLERGMTEPAAAVDGDLRIAEISRRHRNFKVLRRNGPGIFVKQVQNFDPHTIACLQREGTCSWLSENDEGFAPLRGRTPVFRDYDPTRHVLITELFSEAETLTDHHQRHEEFPPWIGAELGRLLGELHTKVRVPEDEHLAAVFPGATPPTLTLHQMPPTSFQVYGTAAAHIVELVRRDPTFTQAFSDLLRDWRKSSLIHGDVKWDNCLLVDPSRQPDEGDLALKLIDWELADVGDPDWDVGAVFQAYLAFWVWSMPTMRNADELVSEARFPIERMQPAMQAFWASYCATRGIAAEDKPRRLRRAVRYGAGRMIQTAFEAAVASRRITAQNLLLVQLSQNLLTRTEDAIHELLGM